jgi:hypothetical protein
MTFTPGVVLGRGTLLAAFRKYGRGKGRRGTSHLLLEGQEARVLSLLTAAHGKPVAGGVIEKIRRAGEFWCAGEKALAQIHLAFIGLPKVDETGAYRLFLAATALEKGVSPSDLMKALGFPRAARTTPISRAFRRAAAAKAGSGRRTAVQPQPRLTMTLTMTLRCSSPATLSMLGFWLIHTYPAVQAEYRGRSAIMRRHLEVLNGASAAQGTAQRFGGRHESPFAASTARQCGPLQIHLCSMSVLDWYSRIRGSQMPNEGKINVSFSASAEDVIRRFMEAVERTRPHPSLVPIIIWWIEGTFTDKATGKVAKLRPSIDVGAIDLKK